MRKLLPVLFFAFALLGCEKEKIEKKPEPTFYPTQIIRTASNTTDSTILKFTYNTENQIIREDQILNNVLERYSLYTYGPTGNLVKKRVFAANGRAMEQEEIEYNAAGLPEKLRHSMHDAAGTPQLHHYRTFVFNAAGQLSSWSDHTPGQEIFLRRVYSYKPDNLVESVATDGNGRFQDQINVTYDGQFTPFENTGTQLVKFAGNELKMEFKSETGQILDSYFNTFEYHENGFPLKKVQTLSTGVVKTEAYVYKPE